MIELDSMSMESYSSFPLVIHKCLLFGEDTSVGEFLPPTSTISTDTGQAME